MIGVISFIIILSILVFIHELGHFLVAKKAGVIVEEFGIGYPPKAKKLFTWRGTEFTLNIIPFGGFVKLAGDEEEIFADERESAGSGKKQGRGSLKAGAKTKAETKSEDQDRGMFYSTSMPKKLAILLAGASFNLLFGLLIFTVIYSYLGIPEPIKTARIGEVVEGSPASKANLQVDTEIVEMLVGGQVYQIKTPAEVIDLVEKNMGSTVTLVTTGSCHGLSCEKSQNQTEVYLRTKEETPSGQGSMGVIFQPATFVKYPFWQMPFRGAVVGLQETLYISEQILLALGDMMGKLIFGGEVPTDVAGPIGIVHQASSAGIFSHGIITILSFTAMLSINLAIMNILPIPPLDGGRAVFVLAQSIFSKKKVKKIEYYLNYGGYVVLLFLILLITARDIWRIFG